MRIVFMGSPDFAVVHLRALLEAGHEIPAVVTVPDKPQGRGRKLRPSPVKQEALNRGIPVLQPNSLKADDFVNALRALNAELFVVVAYRILPAVVFNIPPKGTINVHASLLPKYRGAAPINRAIMNGDTETGVTIIRIDEKVDTGAVLARQKVPITEEMNAGTLHDILSEKGASLLVSTLARLDEIVPLPQDDEQATSAPKIRKETCRIDFNRPVLEVFNLIRGLSPYPAAFCFHQNKMLKIYTAEIAEHSNKTPGRPGYVTEVNKSSFCVACQPGVLRIREVQLQGKRRMPVKDFFNGYTIKPGDVLE